MNSLDKIHRCAVLKIYAVSKFLAVLNTVQLLKRKSFVLLLLTAIMASKGLFKLGKALMFGKTESVLAVSLKSVIHGLVIVCISVAVVQKRKSCEESATKSQIIVPSFLSAPKHHLVLNSESFSRKNVIKRPNCVKFF